MYTHHPTRKYSIRTSCRFHSAPYVNELAVKLSFAIQYFDEIIE